MVDEDWDLLVSFLPEAWLTLAARHEALKGLRKDKSAAKLLRTLLLHVGCGYSLRETVVRAKRARLADLSDVALLKRLRKSQEWLYAMCVALFKERGVAPTADKGFQLRIFDGTNVKEPGPTGSLWRIHYSVQVPSLRCDFFKVTATEGGGTGEGLRQFPINKGDFIIVDRGYCHAGGIHFVASKGAYVTVRINTATISFFDVDGAPLRLQDVVKGVRLAGAISSREVIVEAGPQAQVRGRLCIVRKTEEAIELAHKKLRRSASKKGHALKDDTLEFAKYVIVFSTFPADEFSSEEVLEWYRIRWQVELVFKRFKSLARLGHLPKHDDESARAWLYGKLFVALLTEKLIRHAEEISPWGYDLGATPAKQLA